MTVSNSKDTNQASEELREIFIDSMWNYFGIEDESELDYFGTIYDQAVAPIIRTEKQKLLAEADKSMPTAEQLTTKYGYHMPDKQYGYKLALHDIREVLAKLEAEL